MLLRSAGNCLKQRV